MTAIDNIDNSRACDTVTNVIRLVLLTALVALLAPAQPRGPQVLSPELATDRKVTFRLVAPTATDVKLNSGDMPGNNGPGRPMTKGENGVWEVTMGPLPAGAYRYRFSVNGVATIDPRNNTISESNDNVWSMVVVPGSDLFDTKPVPHGAVAAVTYQSKALNRPRRMHVYTPPGYESGKQRYPIFYLLHGAGDCDEAWSSVGRAGFILDNLIAAGKAKPMIVVMPAGHTSSGGFRVPSQQDEFFQDFTGDIMPYIETHYRVLAKRETRAIAGLSMGGMQTLNIAAAHLDKFAYVGVYSSGLIGMFPQTPRAGAPAAPQMPPGPTLADWEQKNAAMLDSAAVKKGLKLFWLGIGKEDFLLSTHKNTMDVLKKHGFTPTEKITEGGHTWLNWRDYLAEFAPQLFQ
jgi:enterochelin esterase-like enzyme